MMVSVEFVGEAFRPWRVQRHRVKLAAEMTCAVEDCDVDWAVKVVRRDSLRMFVPRDMPIEDSELEPRCRAHRDVSGDVKPEPLPGGKRVEEK